MTLSLITQSPFYLYQVPSGSEDTSMADKEAILATLNIKAMTFDDTFSALPKSTMDLKFRNRMI